MSRSHLASFTLVVLLSGIGLLIWLLSIVLPIRLIDFEHYLLATQIIYHRQNPYGVVEFFAPPWLALLTFPLSRLPIKVASSIWLFSLLSATLASVWISLQWIRQMPGLRSVIILALVPTILPPVLYCYVTGQITPLVNTMVILAAWKIASQSQTGLAAFGLLFASLKPHVVLLPATLCLLEVIRKQQWRLILAVLVGFTTLVGLAFLWRADWLSSLINAWLEGNYKGGKPGLVSPGYVGLIELGIPPFTFAPLVIYLLWQWWRFGLQPHIFALSLAVGLLIAPYSRSYDLVLLIFPLMDLAETSQGRDRWLFAVGTLSFFLLPLTSFSVITSLMFVILLLLKSKKTVSCVR
jgi:hypothetical protein